MKPVVLIVDDEKHTREGLRHSLEESFDVYIASDAAGALSVLEHEEVDVMLTDLRLGADDGMKLIDTVLAHAKPPICIMMTAYGAINTAVEAMKRGAYDFVMKPLNIDELEILINRALRSRKTEAEVVQLKQVVEKQFGLENIIGSSACMEEVFDTIRQVAPSRATVLIQGESGTGKELVAAAIHQLSNRNKTRFIAIHCAALSPQLLESELFGHERGAFTGATEKRIGRFEQANGGTLFLDEIGEIDANTQVKILRALDPGEFERVGGNTTVKVDVRLVCATNKDLAQLVADGKFRDDLFYRLNVVRINMPPLRERREDIPLLVEAFLRKFAEANGKPVRPLSSEAMECVLRHNWKGNVRELRTAIEHGVVMAQKDQINVRDLPQAVRDSIDEIDGAMIGNNPVGSRSNPLNLHDTETRLIMRALEDTDGNRTEAAKKLGISRRTLHRRLHELNIT